MVQRAEKLSRMTLIQSHKEDIMAPAIKKILYATDLSDSARHAFGYAADLAQKYDAMITILYVMENINHMAEIQIRELVGEADWNRLKNEKLGYLFDKIKIRLEDFCQEMDSKFDSCRMIVDDILIKKGNPTEKIIDVSKKIDADLIVMGTYGHNILQSSLIGGTARKVVKSSEIPVLVVRFPKE